MVYLWPTGKRVVMRAAARARLREKVREYASQAERITDETMEPGVLQSEFTLGGARFAINKIAQAITLLTDVVEAMEDERLT